MASSSIHNSNGSRSTEYLHNHSNRESNRKGSAREKHNTTHRDILRGGNNVESDVCISRFEKTDLANSKISVFSSNEG